MVRVGDNLGRPMLVLTLSQPWASLVACGYKRIETRSWRTYYRGPILIHAAKSMPKAGRELAVGLTEEGLQFGDVDHLPRQVILARAKLADVVRVEDLTGEQLYGYEGWERDLGDYSPGRFGWILEAVTPTEHVHAVGMLGLWHGPDL